MSNMFMGAVNFNQGISSWDVSAVTDMFQMFRDAGKFEKNLESWNVASLCDCFRFANGATDWKAACEGSITGKSPPLSLTMTTTGCDSE